MGNRNDAASRALLDRLQADPDFRRLDRSAKTVLRRLVWRYRDDIVGSYHVEAAENARRVEAFARAILDPHNEDPWADFDFELASRALVASRRLGRSAAQAHSPSQLRALARTAEASMSAVGAYEKLRRTLPRAPEERGSSADSEVPTDSGFA